MMEVSFNAELSITDFWLQQKASSFVSSQTFSQIDIVPVSIH